MSPPTKETDVPPELAGTDELRIYEYDRPSLQADDYRIEITEILSKPASERWSAIKNIAVEGDRFSLPPDRVHSVFPPNSAQGDYWHVLPHIVLNRSTLPWERSADGMIDDKNRRPPWLRLLLFDEDDLPDVDRQVVSLSTLAAPMLHGNVSWPGVRIGSSQHGDDQVVVIDIPRDIATALLPAKITDQTLTSHVRKVSALKLHHRIYTTADPDQNAHALRTKWFDDRLKNLFEDEGLPPGDLSMFDWYFSAENETRWQFSIPDVGIFEARSIPQSPMGAYLSFAGGKLNATGPTEANARHGFSLVPMPMQHMASTLESGEGIEWLTFMAQATGLNLRQPSLHREQTDAPVQDLETNAHGEGKMPDLTWRVVCQETGLHLMLRIKGGSCLEIRTYPEAQTEAALIVGNRLPTPGKRCVMHLVSLEDRLHTNPDSGEMQLREVENAGAPKLRLVSLKSWEFHCTDRQADFAGILEQVNREEETQIEASAVLAMPFVEADLDGVNEAAQVAARLANGDIPLRHKMRRGDRTVSWYRGPLAPETTRGAAIAALLPAASSDALVQFDEDLGMFDVSYAAAWELGRLMMLADAPMATKLFKWKRAHAHQIVAARERASFGKLLPLKHRPHGKSVPASIPAMPADLAAWFNDLSLLKRIPYRNLVPDEALLPNNALKFFSLDPVWLACLRDGAFSIGRVLPSDHHADRHRQKTLGGLPRISGFVLRSEVVSDYPDLSAVGYGAAPDLKSPEAMLAHPELPILPCLRQESRGKHVLLMLFDGDLQALDLHRAPQTLHFGFNLPDLAAIRGTQKRQILAQAVAQHDTNTLCKKLRGRGGDLLTAMIGPFFVDHEPGIPVNESRVVDFTTLSARIAEKLEKDGRLVREDGLNPAKFVMEMMEGADLVRFLRPAPATSAGGKT